MTQPSVTATEMNRALQGRDVVQTHVFHIVDEDHDDGAVSTLCDYYLTDSQFERRRSWTETPISVTGICHHCARELRDEVDDDE